MTNLPIKRNNNFFDKIRNWFKNLFYKKAQEIDEVNNDETNENQISKESDCKSVFREEIKYRVDSKLNIEEIRKMVEKNPNLLYTLSLKHLKEIEQYYDKLIAQESDNFKLTSKEDIRIAIENKPELIYGLSLEQLKKLEHYYDNLILMAKK